MKRSTTPLLPYVMRQHRQDYSPSTQRAFKVLQSLLPDDSFSQSQWRVGLEYYARRIEVVATDRRLLLVDLGCGTGNWSIAGSTIFKDIVGVDVNAGRLNAAKHLASALSARNVQFYECPIESAPVSNQTADCVLLCNVLPYARNWRASLLRAVDYLHEDGSLLVGWVDFGIILYTFLESIVGCSRTRLADFYRMTIDRTVRGGVDKPALWISKRKVWDVVAQIGLRRVLHGDGMAIGGTCETAPMLPRRFAGTPFYHELILRKRAIQ